MGNRGYASPELARAKAASESSNEIMPGLVIGSLSQCEIAIRNGYQSICVRHIKCSSPSCVHSKILDLTAWVVSRDEVEAFADALRDMWLLNGKKTYVHCFHGIERAPLAVAYAIKRDVTPKMSFEEVYKFVLRMRPVGLDRTNWLEQVP